MSSQNPVVPVTDRGSRTAGREASWAELELWVWKAVATTLDLNELCERLLVLLRGAFDVLMSYDWPGNIRELAAVIERAAILGEGIHLEVPQALGVTVSSRSPASAPHDLKAANISQIERALADSHGQIEGPKGAAALLGINPHTLRSRMRKLGINWSEFRK